jgi:hypothetical protein
MVMLGCAGLLAAGSTAHRMQPPLPGSAEARVLIAQSPGDRVDDRAGLHWALEVRGRRVGGEGGVVRSNDRVMVDFQEPWGSVGVRFLMDARQAAVVVPELRTQFVGTRAGWAWGEVTGDDPNLLRWVALVVDPLHLPSAPPVGASWLHGRVEAVWSDPARRVVLGEDGLARTVAWGVLGGKETVEANYKRYDDQGRPLEVEVVVGSLGDRLHLAFDRWTPLDPDTSIPPPDAVPVGMKRRPLESFGIGSWLEGAGFMGGDERPAP